MTPTVRQMLQGKPVVHAVQPEDTVYLALRLMADKNIGAVLVRSGARSSCWARRRRTHLSARS